MVLLTMSRRNSPTSLIATLSNERMPSLAQLPQVMSSSKFFQDPQPHTCWSPTVLPVKHRLWSDPSKPLSSPQPHLLGAPSLKRDKYSYTIDWSSWSISRSFFQRRALLINHQALDLSCLGQGTTDVRCAGNHTITLTSDLSIFCFGYMQFTIAIVQHVFANDTFETSWLSIQAIQILIEIDQTCILIAGTSSCEFADQ